MVEIYFQDSVKQKKWHVYLWVLFSFINYYIEEEMINKDLVQSV